MWRVTNARLTPRFAQRQHQLRREVQTRGGGRHRSLDPAVDRLVAFGVGQRLVDIGRQRHLAGVPQPLLHRRIERDDAAAILSFGEDGRCDRPI